MPCQNNLQHAEDEHLRAATPQRSSAILIALASSQSGCPGDETAAARRQQLPRDVDVRCVRRCEVLLERLTRRLLAPFRQAPISLARGTSCSTPIGSCGENDFGSGIPSIAG